MRGGLLPLAVCRRAGSFSGMTCQLLSSLLLLTGPPSVSTLSRPRKCWPVSGLLSPLLLPAFISSPLPPSLPNHPLRLSSPLSPSPLLPCHLTHCTYLQKSAPSNLPRLPHPKRHIPQQPRMADVGSAAVAMDVGSPFVLCCVGVAGADVARLELFELLGCAEFVGLFLSGGW